MSKKIKMSFASFSTLLLAFAFIFIGCSKDEEESDVEPATNNSSTSYTITVGVYTENGGTYTDQNKDLVFINQAECQSWSRSAQGGDGHSDNTHDHYNAAKNTVYDEDTETISWDEYGPELDQAAIDATCEAGSGGATKTANKTDYSVDKNFYLQIKSVVEN